jgi:hypothetical protein
MIAAPTESADPANPGAILFREVGDGRGIWVYPMIYTFSLAIGPLGSPCYDNYWCYRDLLSVMKAYSEWDVTEEPEPQGWVRHPKTGRRRFPSGDPATEEVRL